MAQYRVTLRITEDKKRGARESVRYRLLKMLTSQGVSQPTLRSVRVRRIA